MFSIKKSLKRKFRVVSTIFLTLFLFSLPVIAQDSAQTSDLSDTSIKTNQTNEAAEENTESWQKYRFLQSNDFLVDTAYLQEEGELQHTFTFSRSNRHNWSMVFIEEIPLGSEKHQLSISVPYQLMGNGTEGFRGFGDTQIEYNYGLFGDSNSRITIAPGLGLSLPSGNSTKKLGSGGTGISFNVPIGVMLAKRFASNSSFEMTYTKSAQNEEDERANTFGYEFGQSFVWFAKPKLNFLVEAVWEREQKVTGQRLKQYESEFLISPGVRWAHTFKNGLIISPGVAVPVGVGPSRGENGIFFYLSFEHSFRKEH